MPLYYPLRAILHLLLALVAPFLLLLATSPFDKLESSTEQNLRRHILVSAATSLGSLFVLRVGDDVGFRGGTVHDGLVAEEEGLRKGMGRMEGSLGLVGTLSWGAALLRLLASPISKRRPLVPFLCSTMAIISLAALLLHLALPKSSKLVEGGPSLGRLEEQLGDQEESLLPPLDDAGSSEEDSNGTLSDIVFLSLLGGSLLSLEVSSMLVPRYEMDRSVSFLLISSTLILPSTFFSRQHYRTQLVLATSILLILQCFAVASYGFVFASDLHPLCAVFFDQDFSLAITYPPPVECELSRSLLFLSAFTLVALAGRLVVLRLTPRKTKIALDSYDEGSRTREKRTVGENASLKEFVG